MQIRDGVYQKQKSAITPCGLPASPTFEEVKGAGWPRVVPQRTLYETEKLRKERRRR